MQRGKIIVVGIIAVTLFVNIFVTVVNFLVSTDDIIFWSISAALFIALYRGENWAKILIGTFLAISGFSGIMLFVGTINASLNLIVIGLLHLTSASLLFIHTDVKSFLEFQKVFYSRSEENVICPFCFAELELEENEKISRGLDCPDCNEYIELNRNF